MKALKRKDVLAIARHRACSGVFEFHFVGNDGLCWLGYGKTVPEALLSVEPVELEIHKTVAALVAALQYAEHAIAKIAEHCDLAAVEELGLDVQDCRDCVGLAIERAGGEVAV